MIKSLIFIIGVFYAIRLKPGSMSQLDTCVYEDYDRAKPSDVDQTDIEKYVSTKTFVSMYNTSN